MNFDFSRIGNAKRSNTPTNPIEIFKTLPSLKGTPNDLWHGQYKALSEWYEMCCESDILISLNTGAGKTIVGLLITQSLVNQGLENVVYVCSTIDLVKQTSKEAERIGINYTMRIDGRYSNDLFEIGKAFCITTYSALFNGYSSIRAKFFPKAIIFDDAHVAESLLRNAFTLRISVKNNEKNKTLFNDIKNLFEPHFEELNILGQFTNSLDPTKNFAAFVAPNDLYDQKESLLSIFENHNIKNDKTYKFQFAWLEDHLDSCAAIFTRGVFELTPPFLPSLALDIFKDKDIRRVYLSATLPSQTEFIRAFGRKPSKTITLENNDAGNGERIILNDQKVQKGFGPEFAEELVKKHKVVIAVPDYARASEWESLAEPPERDNFTDKLNQFRDNSANDAFMLVSRVDGIDLPHNTCRIMIMDGLPCATSCLERYQWEFLKMSNVQARRVANRLAQLFGRINRGRNDYSSFLLRGDSLRKWISRESYLALLPSLLQNQILIGNKVQNEFNLKEGNDVIALIDKILSRDEGWLDYYGREIEQTKLDESQRQQAEDQELVMVEATLSEAKYAAAMWRHDAVTARCELEATVNKIANFDKKLGGWHYVWLGAAYELVNDKRAACLAYKEAMFRLPESMTLPKLPELSVEKEDSNNLSEFGKSLNHLFKDLNATEFQKLLNQKSDMLEWICTGKPSQAEAGVCELGKLLGFEAIRPDKEVRTGPDVLWLDKVQLYMIAFELKTDKKNPAEYTKRDITQGHDHIQWMKENYSNFISLKLLYIGPNGLVNVNANPSKEMGLCLLENIVALSNEIIALIKDLYRQSPIERPKFIFKNTKKDQWNINNLQKRLLTEDMIDLKGTSKNQAISAAK